jgi:ribosomal protein S12
VDNQLTLCIAIAAKNLNGAIMKAMENGLTVQTEVIINNITFDGGNTVDEVPEVIVRVFNEVTIDVN